MQRPEKRRFPPIVWICIVAAVLRMGILSCSYVAFGDWQGVHAPDTGSYLGPARELLRAATFFDAEQKPELVRTPGFPLLMTPGIAFGHVELVTAGLQIALSIATIALVYSLGLLLTENERIARIAALLLAVEPMSAIYCSYLLSETLFAFLVVACCYFAVRYLQSLRPSSLVLAGLALCGSVYVRPISYFLPAAICAGLLVLAVADASRRWQRVRHAVVFAALCGVLIGVWQVRNVTVAGYSGFSAISDHNLYFYQAASVLGKQSGKGFQDAQIRLGYFDDEVFRARYPDLDPSDQASRFAVMRREASQIIGSAMAEYAQIHLRGMGMLLANPGSSDLLRLINCYPESSSFQGAAVDLGVLGSAKRVWEQSPAIFVASVGLGAMNIAYFALALRGWIRHGVRSSAGFWLVTLTALYFFILSGGPAAVARLRHPLMPCACLLAACGASRKQVSIQIGDAGQSRPSSDRKAA